jgi:hypothetical protein
MMMFLIAMLTLLGVVCLSTLLSGASKFRKGAIIVTFLSFLAWSWVMAYFIATKQ